MIAMDRLLEFALPAGPEAHEPPGARGLARDQVRLLISSPTDGRTVHRQFSDWPDFLCPGDLLVANDSATLPAALTARRTDGTAFALHLSTPLSGGVWTVEPRKVTVKTGEVLELPGGGDHAARALR